MKERETYIDIAKGICIILVAIGHFNPSAAPMWWQYNVDGIYAFHMPTFMFLSGLLYMKTMRPEPYVSFMSRKLKRLMVPYLSASIVIIVIKLIAQNLLPVKNTASAIALLEMFIRPSAAVHLWFVWTLLCIFAIVRPAGGRRVPMIVLSVVSLLAWVLPLNLPEQFGLDHIPTMLVFFMGGCLVGHILMTSPGLTVRSWLRPLILLLFIASEILYVSLGSGMKICVALTAVLGIASVIVLSKWIDCYDCRSRRVLLTLGESSFFIYLFHTTFSELTKVLLQKAGLELLPNFILILFISVTAGLLCPILVQKLIVERSKILSFLFGVTFRGKADLL